MDELTVSVIIPTWKPGEELRELLRRLNHQTLEPLEILIVNTDQEQFNEDLLRGTRGVRVVHIQKEDFDHGGTRAMAAELTAGDILVYMTMDAVPADRYLLERLIRPFADPLVACAYARQLPSKDSGVLERFSRSFNYGRESLVKTGQDLEKLGIKTFFCSNVCAAYRRDTYQKLGGFVRRTIFNEDMIFAGRAICAGYAVAYQAEARVIHSHNYSPLQHLRRSFDMGVSQADHPEIFGLAKSETEGKKLVSREAGWLASHGYICRLPELALVGGCKYLGYRLGKAYRTLPDRLIRHLTANPGYWQEDAQTKSGQVKRTKRDGRKQTGQTK